MRTEREPQTEREIIEAALVPGRDLSEELGADNVTYRGRFGIASKWPTAG